MEVYSLENNQETNEVYTVSGTNIDEVKRNNAQSGLTYNEVKELLAQTTGNEDEGSYSQSDISEVKNNHQHHH